LTDTLVQLVLKRIDRVEAPVLLHREIAAFPANEGKALCAAGILRETSRATEVPRPPGLPRGDDLTVRQTSRGLFGVASDDDYFDPVPLTEDDVRQYEVVVPKLAARIRRANRLQGGLHQDGEHLFSLGEKRLPWGIRASVYLSLLNTDESDLLGVAQRLRPVQPKPVLILTPTPAPLSVAGRQALTESGTHVVPLSDYLEPGSWAITWDEALPARGDQGELTARNAHCFAVTHDDRRYLDESAYRQLMAAAGDYHVFADGLTHEVRKKQGKKIIRTTDIPASYFQVLRAVVDKRGYFDPAYDDPDPERFSGRQILQRARKTVDIKYRDAKGKMTWRLFKTSKPANRAVYRFDPDADFPFALIFLPHA